MDAAERGHISKSLHFNTVLGVLDSEATTPILYELIVRSASPLRAVEDTFAVDSSGFSGCKFLRWFDEKYGKAWLADHPGVVVEDFPGYVPDLNPDEGVRGWAKYGRLANLAASDKDELWDRVVDEWIEVKFRPDLLRGFVRQTGLPGVAVAA